MNVPRVTCHAFFLFLLCVSCTAGRIERAIAKADALRGTQQYEAALRAYEMIVLEYPNHPKDAEVLLRIGDLHNYTLKDTAQAVDTYQRIIATWPWQPAAIQARVRLAEIATAREDYTSAVEYYEQLLKYFPAYDDWDIVRHAIGVCYLKQKQYVQARIEFTRLLEQDNVRPDVRAQTLYDTAETFLLEGKPEGGVKYYQQLVKDFPGSELAKQARLQLVHCYGEAGQYPEALSLAEALRREFPDDPVVTSRLKQLLDDKAGIGRPGKLPWEHKRHHAK